MKNLNHPGIPLIFDIDEDDQFLYMVEEFIQGESLDTFVLHQDNISQELIVKFGIQLCGILAYLHQLSPYPILYQDLKPEHIIVCGDQLKLVDFGIASFFTGSGKIFQFFGTKDYAAPEVIAGTDLTPQSDLYSLGKVLLFLIREGNIPCSTQLFTTIQKACAESAADRYETVSLFQSALEKEAAPACHSVFHLSRKIIVSGSKHGIGTTHIAISLNSFLNQNGFHALYVEKNGSDSLQTLAHMNLSMKETNGIWRYRFFRGIPDYGLGIALPLPEDLIYIEDHDVCFTDMIELEPENLHIFVMDGSDWNMEDAILAGKKLSFRDNVIFICNYDNRKAAKKFARVLHRKVYCFPFDPDAFCNSAKKQTLFSSLLPIERRRRHFSHFIQKENHPAH